jgi:Protein of unknown function, DUF488
VLALIEAFGGSLNETDCHKLLFLLCEETKTPQYDFFPYRFGCYSITASQDLAWLVTHGWLRDHSGFRLDHMGSHAEHLTPADLASLESLHSRFFSLRGRELITFVYRNFPDYAVRSEIARKVLPPEDFERIQAVVPARRSATLLTLGYEGKSIDAYLRTLIQEGVDVLVDVRQNPVSRKYGFAKSTLSTWAQNVGMEYIHIPELGIPSRLRQGLDVTASRDTLLQNYRNKLLPAQPEAIDVLRNVMAKDNRIALTCFEADADTCHRSRLVEYLAEQPWCNHMVRHVA